MNPAIVALAVLAPIAFGAPPPAENGYAECEAFAPFEDFCAITITPVSNVYLTIDLDLVYSGTLDLQGEQNGVVIWNGTCIIPAGFFDGGVGTCGGEPGPSFATGVPLTLTVRVGLYGYGTFGVQAQY